MVYIADINDYNELFFELALRLLPQEKLEETMKISHETSKKETVLAWTLLRFALSKTSFAAFPALAFSERGKPFFENERLFFNLSHSKGRACAAISSVGEIGVDVQKKSSFSPGMIKKVFAEGERSLAENVKSREALFTRLWAIKESFLKNTGTGIAFEFRSLDFSKQCFLERFEKDGFHYSTFSDGEFEFCVCAKEECEQNFEYVPSKELIDFVKITAKAAKGEV